MGMRLVLRMNILLVVDPESKSVNFINIVLYLIIVDLKSMNVKLRTVAVECQTNLKKK